MIRLMYLPIMSNSRFTILPSLIWWNLETVVLRVAYGEAYPVHGNRSFLYGHIAFGSHFGIEVVGEGIVSASVDKIYFCAAGCLVHMALHDVSVEAAVHEHATFEIHFVSDRESP